MAIGRLFAVIVFDLSRMRAHSSSIARRFRRRAQVAHVDADNLAPRL